jgi:thiamine pyrophosphate-dependent acetolactate synthase large subunit-like protein
MERNTAGALLARVLRAGGVDAVYGRPLPGVDVVDVADGRVASLLAAAHRRVHGRGAAVIADGAVVVGPGPAAGSPTRAPAAGAADASISEPADLVDAAGELVGAVAAGHLRLQVGFDPASPVPDVVPPRAPAPDRWVLPDDTVVEAVQGARSPVVLAGPGVVTAGAVPGLHAMAAAAGVGVLNTWGAKGVFDWRSRHHLATGGLQADDFALAGFGAADLIVATGVDPDEAPDERWRLAPVVEVPPGALDPLAAHWVRARADITLPPLREELARVTQEGWAATGTPLAPSLVTRHYAEALGGGGMIAADPGVGGYWVARTFATTELGGVHVPAQADGAGTAAACAVVARLRSSGRAVLAVVDAAPGQVAAAGARTAGSAADAVDPATAAVLDAARRLGVAVPRAVWSDDGEGLDADAHLARLRAAVVADDPAPVVLATDRGQLDRMIGAAGPVIAWGGLA